VRKWLVTILDRISIMLAAILFDKILFISPMLGAFYTEKMGIPNPKIGFWPSSVDTTLFDPISVSETKRLRFELGLSAHTGFLYHGSLSRGRAIVEMIEAFRVLREENVKVRLVLLGYGALRDTVLDYVKSGNLEDVVGVHGPVKYADVPRYIAACDVGLVPLPDHPWWRYQCPVKVIECLAMNKPLIVSNIPAHRWVISGAPVAIYLNGTTPSEIADGVRTYLKHKNSLDPSIGRQTAENFSTRKIAESLEQQFLSILTKSSS